MTCKHDVVRQEELFNESKSVKQRGILCTCLLLLAIGCSSDTLDQSTPNGETLSEDMPMLEGSTTGGPFESCEVDKPVNIDGYYTSGVSPRSLFQTEGSHPLLHNLQEVSGLVRITDYRIGIAASYNLGVATMRQIDDPDAQGYPDSRYSCLPPGRITAGPVMTRLEITADEDIGPNYPAGSHLNAIVSIAPLERADDANYPPTQAWVPSYVRTDIDYQSLNGFIDSAPNAPVVLLLRIDGVEPLKDVPYIFSMAYALGSGMSGTLSMPPVSFY